MQLPRLWILVLCAASLAGPAAAQISPASPPGWPQRVPAPGGEVLLPTPGARQAYDAVKYSSSRRVGDTLYVSGVVAGGASPGRPADAATFKASLRRAFLQIERNLKAAGAGFSDVVMINSFHVWESPHFTGGRDEHFAAVSEVKDEFMRAPHPAWTAVGTTGLLAPTGLVEIEVIAHAPSSRALAR